MSSHILLKLKIFAASFVINGLMFAGVNYLFNGHMDEHTARALLAHGTDGARLLVGSRATGLEDEGL
jgi:hypothetical protein